jgi:hypothetical protein
MIDLDEQARKAVFALFAHEEYGDETHAMGYALDFARAILAQAATIKALRARVAKADELVGATDKLARFAFSHMAGGRQDLVDNAAAALRSYRATATDTGAA